MRILITGGAGFIGSNLGAHLAGNGHEITLYDQEEARVPGCRAIRGDILDHNLLATATQNQEAIIHLAAMVSAPASVAAPDKAAEINVKGSKHVLAAALESGVKRIILASTAAVYGESPSTPTREEHPTAPMSPYATTKEQMEAEASATALSTCCFRIFNVYGPGQKANSQYAAAIPAFITHAMKNEPLTIYGDGKQTRDFIYVKDLCRAFELALEKGKGVINIASGAAVTINDLAATIIKLANSSSTIIHEAARDGDPKRSLADVSKAKAELGFEATTTLEQGLKETIAWYNMTTSSPNEP